MKNRFLKRGIILIVLGVALNIAGYFMMNSKEFTHYGWAMIAGTVLFGIGFLSFFYSFVRKVEAKGIIEERAAEAEKKEKFSMEQGSTA